MAIRAKKTLDMNMMQRQETPPRMDRDLLEELHIKVYKWGLSGPLTNGSTWTGASTLGFSGGTGGRKRDWRSRSTWGRTYSEEEPARPRCQWELPPARQKYIINGKTLRKQDWEDLKNLLNINLKQLFISWKPMEVLLNLSKRMWKRRQDAPLLKSLLKRILPVDCKVGKRVEKGLQGEEMNSKIGE